MEVSKENSIFAALLRNLRNKHKLHDMNKIENPFLVYGYEEPAYFCDRQKKSTYIKQETGTLYMTVFSACG